MSLQATFTQVDHRSQRTGEVGIQGEAHNGHDGPVQVRIRLTKPEARQVIHELMEWLQAGTR